MLSIEDIEELCKILNKAFKNEDIDIEAQKLWNQYQKDYNYMRFGETNVGI